MRTRAAWINIAVLTVTLIACAGVAETILSYQYAHARAALIARYEHREACAEADPDLVYRLIPGQCGANSKGYRDREHDYDKPEGRFRTVVIGDSVVEGGGVPLEQTFAGALEQKLDRHLSQSGRSAEVIVLARTGYSIYQQLVLLEREAFLYSPDLIIWSYVLNDPAHPVYHNPNGGRGRYFYEPRIHLVEFLKRNLFYAQEKLKRMRCDSTEFHRFMHCGYWPEASAGIESIGSITAEYGTPVVFMIHPVFGKSRNFDTYTLGSVHRKLADAAAHAGLIVLDLLPAYDGYPSDAIKKHNKNWFDPWHLNATGHRLTAEYVFKVLADNGLVK